MVTAWASGEPITSARLNEGVETSGAITKSDTQNTSGTTTSTSYTTTLTGGTACGASFTAPESGEVMIFNSSGMFNSTTAHCYCGIQVRAGSTVGSGTIILTVSDTDANYAYQVTQRQTVAKLLSGLTSGSSYNVQQLFKVDGGTGTFNNKHLIVQPVINT